ncbi:MAG: PEP-CTERM sorting domain-containing protein [Pseudomonadota bacterium]
MKLLASISAAALASMGVASAAVIDFENFATGTDLTTLGVIAVPGAPGVTYTVSVSGPNDNSALIFDTGLSGTADPDLEAPFDDPNTPAVEMFMPGKVLIIGNNNGNLDDDPNGGIIELAFNQLLDFVSINLFDTGDGGAQVNITLSDGSTEVYTGIGANLGDNEYTTFTFTGDTTAKVQSIQLTGSGAIDEIVFNEITVSEPGVIGLFGLGLLGLGFAARRRA